jgi:hypothetical protein
MFISEKMYHIMTPKNGALNTYRTDDMTTTKKRSPRINPHSAKAGLEDTPLIIARSLRFESSSLPVYGKRNS